MTEEQRRYPVTTKLDLESDPFILRPELLQFPGIPKSLHGLSPRTIMGQEWWDEQRKEVYAKAGTCCQACGVYSGAAEHHQWVEAHEVYEYDYTKCLATFIEIVCLCYFCHQFAHLGRLDMMDAEGQIDGKLASAIRRHGFSILRKAKLLKKYHPVNMSLYNTWKLSFNGKTYKGRLP